MSQEQPSATVAAVVGFRGEARCLRGLGVGIACSGGSAERARSEARRLVAEGAAALVSFGLAGGLAPGLRPGDLLLPHLVRSTGPASWPVDPVWRERVQARLAAGGIQPNAGAVVGSDRILATAAPLSASRTRPVTTLVSWARSVAGRAIARREMSRRTPELPAPASATPEPSPDVSTIAPRRSWWARWRRGSGTG